MDLSPLIKGIMVVIGLALATGHYGDLQRWARRQAIQALEWREPLPVFFPEEHEMLVHHRTLKHSFAAGQRGPGFHGH